MTSRLLVIVGIALVFAGCSSGAGAPPAAQNLAVPWSPKDSGISFAVPPATAKAAISDRDAYALCLKGAADCDPSTPTEISLALVTDPGFETTDASGKSLASLSNTLVWTIRWNGIACPPSAGGAHTLATPTLATPEIPPLCDKFALVDATSGAFIYSYVYPHE
jgi:hypothetical protein